MVGSPRLMSLAGQPDAGNFNKDAFVNALAKTQRGRLSYRTNTVTLELSSCPYCLRTIV
jgi:hypothetical protein